jgi:hypothetical protein
MVGTGLVTAPAASASTNSAQLCQGASAALYYDYYKSDGTIATWSKTCSGDYSLNSRGYYLDPGGWSGYIWIDGAKYYFCDWQDGSISGRVTRIQMAASKIAEC